MNIGKIEIWVHDHILKNDTIRHVVYGAYQRALYLVSPKIQFDGPVEKITPDDGYEYLFGYYDKCPWSDDGKYLLALKVRNASTEPDSTKPADIVRIELETRKIEKLATTHSWNVQQGCMAQWLSNNEILYNDFRDGKYCAVVLNLNTRSERIIDMPIYAMSPDRTVALSLDFSRLHRLRPGYGYGNIPEKTNNEKCPDAICIWKIDIATGKITPILKYTDFASFEPKENMVGAEHKVNHLMISPNGRRFMVLHRWFQKGQKFTRLVTCNMDGSDMYNLSDDDFVSHCCWKNDEEILSYLNKNNGGKGYYLMKDKTHIYEKEWPELIMDGHPSYSYDGRFAVTDTYPDRRRIQSLYILQEFDVRRICRVFSPFKYSGNVRCDLHPRWSQDGKKICFDTSFSGKRSICVIDTGIENSVKKINPTDMDNTLISIVMPVFNASKVLNRSIGSVINQTDSNWELIAIDDGSNDESLSILRDYAEKDRRIRVYSQVNSGPGAARNLGIENAKGDYIAFLDSDDYLDKDYIKIIRNRVYENQPDIIYLEMSFESEGIVKRRTNMYEYVSKGKDILLRSQLSGKAPWSSLVKVVKRQYINKFGIRFSDYLVGEEAIYSFRLVYNTDRIMALSRVLYHVVISPNGQHSKGELDPWSGVCSGMQQYIKSIGGEFDFQKDVNNLAMKALSISLYRIASQDISLMSRIIEMKKKVKEYKSKYNIKNCNKECLSSEALLLKPFIRIGVVVPIIVASKIRKNSK